MNIKIKIADRPEEMKQIIRLNYKTFVEEIPQHSPNDERELKDKFHKKNIYIIALSGNEVIGMLSINGERPFSLDNKIYNLDEYLPSYNKICEIRLLSVKSNYRGGRVFFKIMNYLKDFTQKEGYDLAVISGTTRQLKLYKTIGFKEFGPLVGLAEALFQPMYLTSKSMKHF